MSKGNGSAGRTGVSATTGNGKNVDQRKKESYTTRFNDVFKSAPAKGGSREITSPDGTSVLINHVAPGYGSGGIFNVVIRKEGGEAERYAYRYGSSGMADAGTKASAWKRAKDTAASASQYYQKKRS